MNVNCIVTMGLVPEIKYLVSCILYLVSCKNIIDILSISFLKIFGAKNNPVRFSSDQY